MNANFSPGDRVRVSDLYHWAQGEYGTSTEPPTEVAALADGWQGCFRLVETTGGPQPYFWVSFDEPQRDADGDGPYDGAEIPASALAQA